MTKSDLIAAVATKTGLTKKASAEAVDSMLDSVTGALRKGDRVTVTGFGTFEVRTRRARKGRNPQTGAEIQIPATKAPAFRAGKSLRAAVK